jgi:hypothetical protein
MKTRNFLKSPVFPQSHTWKPVPRKGGYESEITALIRAIASDDQVREDQKVAWDRWRNDSKPLRQP